MSTYYVPGLGEKDPDKTIRSLMQAHEKTAANEASVAANTANIATNTADIATNTADIATNTADIATNTVDIAANTAAISALPAAGASVQTVYAELVTHTTGTTAMSGGADTVPQNTDGTQLLSVAITPKSVTNKLSFSITIPATNSSAVNMWVAVFQDSTAAALFATPIGVSSAEFITPASLSYQMTAGTTSSTTFKIRIGNLSGSSTWAVNGLTSARRLGGSARVAITIVETKA